MPLLLENGSAGRANNFLIPGVGSVQIPGGTTAQRPTGVPGMFRVNSTIGETEYVDGDSTSFIPLGPLYDIRRAGAALSGSGDDTAAWNAANSTLEARGGGTILHPGGDSRCTGTITWGRNVSCLGVGGGSTDFASKITFAHSSPNTDGIVYTTVPGSGYNDMGCFDNLKITGDSTNTRYLMDFVEPSRLILRNCVVGVCATAAVRLRGGIRCSFDHSRFSGSLYNLLFDTKIGDRGTTFYASHCAFRQGVTPIYFKADGYGRCTFFACDVEDNSGAAVNIEEGCQDIFFIATQVEDSDNDDSGDPVFKIGVDGSGSNACRVFIRDGWFAPSTGTTSRVFVEMDRAYVQCGQLNIGSCYDGLASLGSSNEQLLSLDVPPTFRDVQPALLDASSVNNWDKVRLNSSFGIASATRPLHTPIDQVRQELLDLSVSGTTTFNAPANSIPTKVYIENETTPNATWSAAFTGGLSDPLISGVAAGSDEGILISGEPVATSDLNVSITGPSTGSLRVTLFYRTVHDAATPLNAFRLQGSAAPAMNVAGDIARDTSISGWNNEYIRYYDGTNSEEMVVLAMPSTAFESPTNNYIPSYNSTTEEFEFVANTGGGGSLFTETGGSPNVTYITDLTSDLAVGGTTDASPFYFDESLGKLHLYGTTNVISAVRNTTTTNSTTRSTVRFEARTTQSSRSDGFGGRFEFLTGDSTTDEELCAAIYWVRDGGNTSGRLDLLAFNGGTPVTVASFLKEGDVAVGGTTAADSTFFLDEDEATLRVQGQNNPLVWVINPTANTTGHAEINLASDSSNLDQAGLLRSYAASFVEDGALKPASLLLLSNTDNTNGMSIAARSGDVRIYAGGIADGDLIATFLDNGDIAFGENDTLLTADLFWDKSATKLQINGDLPDLELNGNGGPGNATSLSVSAGSQSIGLNSNDNAGVVRNKLTSNVQMSIEGPASSQIFFATGGSIGVKEESPDCLFEVAGAIHCHVETNPFGATSVYPCLMLGQRDDASASVVAGRNTGTNAPFTVLGYYDDPTTLVKRIVYIGGGGFDTPDAMQIDFYTADTYNETTNEADTRARIYPDGKMCVGSVPGTANSQLEVSPNGSSEDGIRVYSRDHTGGYTGKSIQCAYHDGNDWLEIFSNSDSLPTILLKDWEGTGECEFRIRADNPNSKAMIGTETDDEVVFRANATDVGGYSKYGLNLFSRTDATRGTPPSGDRVVIFNEDDGQVNIWDGTNWTLPDGTTT